MWLWIIIWIGILIFNAVHSFLPSKYQTNKWIRTIAIIVATVILIRGLSDEISNYRGRIFAYISKDGKVINKKNFPWKVSKSTTKEGAIVFIINERYGDASEVSITPDVPNSTYTIYNAMNGVGIKFECPEDQIPNFKIRIDR